jgi:hypothetical protein
LFHEAEFYLRGCFCVDGKYSDFLDRRKTLSFLFRRDVQKENKERRKSLFTM